MTTVQHKTHNVQQLIQKAAQLHQAGQLGEAQRIYKQALSLEPNNFDGLHLLGLIEHRVGNFDEAINLISKAIQYNDKVPDFHFNLACVLKDFGKLSQAIDSFKNTLKLKPDDIQAYINLSNIYQSLGKTGEAADCYRQALTVQPDNVEALNYIGNLRLNQCRHNEALEYFDRAIKILPDSPQLHSNRGLALMYAGEHIEAFKAFHRAMKLDPDNKIYWAQQANSLQRIAFKSIDEQWLTLLHNLLSEPTINPSQINQPITSALRCHPDISGFITEKTFQGLAFEEKAERLSGIPLLLKLMSLSPIVDRDIEELLTKLRRDLILAVHKDEPVSMGLSFFAALAEQCFFNDYVFEDSDEEETAVCKLEEKIQSKIAASEPIQPIDLIALGTYRPLFRYPWAKTMLDKSWPKEMAALWLRQVREPLEELSLRATIPCLTPMNDAISQAVREQYEENPYPRWIRYEETQNPQTVKDLLHNLFPNYAFGDYVSPERPEILIAGCGTGRHPFNTASRLSNAKILAVDLSLSSIAYAMRKTRESGFSNIDYAQADILELGSINKSFDIVESVGVLHHLDDPMKGWRVLVNLLRKGGFMRMGLYSEIARELIVKARHMIAQNAIASTPKDIRRARARIAELSVDNESKIVTTFSDFYSLSECRDLLFHVQEHRYTLLQIEDALNELGLDFIGFELWNVDIFGRFTMKHPNPADLRNLSLWHQFEIDNPKTFTGMYQFWCRKVR